MTFIQKNCFYSTPVSISLPCVGKVYTRARKLNPALHDCCRIISGCLKPTNIDSVHLLAGIAPPHIRRTVSCRMERTRQTTDARHQLFHHRPAASRLKSRKSFMRTVTPLDSSASCSRLRLWKDSLTDMPASVKMGLEVAEWPESLPAGSGEDWLCWRSLNRLRTGVGCAKTVMRRWGYLDDAQSVDCDSGEPQTMAHLLSCRLLDEACTADDLATVTERAKGCARKWENFVWRTRQKKKYFWTWHVGSVWFYGSQTVDLQAYGVMWPVWRLSAWVHPKNPIRNGVGFS